MLCTIEQIKEEGNYYSFGQIKEVNDDKITVMYKNYKIKLKNIREKREVGEWIRFYGKYYDLELDVFWMECLIGIDVSLLEKVMDYMCN